MEYNTIRPELTIPEYGRNIHIMVQHATNLEDREERNRCANAIVKVMGQLNPQLSNVEEFKPKLWAHLYIMSDFKIDVDSPYPIPTRESFMDKPNKVPYPEKSTRFKHYGTTIQNLIKEAIKEEDEEKRNAFTLMIVNMMKKSYLMFNRDNVSNDIILKNLDQISEGKLSLPEDMHDRITSTAEIKRNSLDKPNTNYKKHNKNKKKKKRY